MHCGAIFHNSLHYINIVVFLLSGCATSWHTRQGPPGVVGLDRCAPRLSVTRTSDVSCLGGGGGRGSVERPPKGVLRFVCITTDCFSAALSVGAPWGRTTPPAKAGPVQAIAMRVLRR